MFGLSPKLLLILGGVAAVLAILAGVYFRGRGDERTENEAEKAVATAEALKVDEVADNQANEQRIEDAEATAELREELIDAVQSVPDSVPAPAAVALGCQRLLNAGHRPSDLPAVCRHEGAGQAAPVH